ncbi:MAG: phosphate ABC transporter permease PstA [Propionibacteriaceae bacterium]|jgi:phosphate transport system permease protein|nr:phosphate ABC transporter permease PstA [Propionibacteriaceae bacterium]
MKTSTPLPTKTTATTIRINTRRRVADRGFTLAVIACGVLAVIPLLSVVWTTVSKGLGRIDVAFFTQSMRGITDAGGGALHAIMGTLLITCAATLVAVPIAIGSALWLVEYADNATTPAIKTLARTVRTVIDVMAGIPSIVAGLFVYAVIALTVGPGYRSGLAGAFALVIIMVPVVERSGEEVLARVPAELHEAALALGVPKWRVILKVVLPTALPGLVSTLLLGVSRIVGETAPLLLVAGFTDSMNYDLTSGRMVSLPVYVYSQWQNKGVDAAAYDARAWSAALVLLLGVVLLHTLARLIVRGRKQ